MKKILYITLAAATIFPMSCQKQTEAISSQAEATPFVIRGVIDDSLTKTGYTDEGTYYSFTWKQNDLVSVQVIKRDDSTADKIQFKAESNAPVTNLIQVDGTFDLTELGTTGGAFTKTSYKLGDFAFYPVTYSAEPTELSYNHSGGTVVLNNNISYNSTNPTAGIPLIGKKSTGNGTPNAVFNFKNVTGVLKLSLSGIPSTATKLVVTANGDVNVTSGKNVMCATWTLSDALYDNGLTMGTATNASNSRTIPISAISSCDFYIPVPIGTLEGVRIELLNSANERLYCVSTAENIVINRSAIKSLTPIEVKSPTITVSGTADNPKLNYDKDGSSLVSKFYAYISTSETHEFSKYHANFCFSNSSGDYELKGWDKDENKLVNSGKFYLHWLAVTSAVTSASSLTSLSDTKIKTYGTIPFYYITSDDLNRVIGTYSVLTVGQAASIQDLKIKVSDNCGAGSIRMRYFYNYDQLVGTGIYGYVEGTNATFFSGQHFRTNSSGDNNFFMGYESWNGSAFVNTADVVFSIGVSNPQVLSKTSPAIVADVSFNPIANYPTTPKKRAEFTSVTATRTSSDEPAW